MSRKPAVAGTFYSSGKRELQEHIASMMPGSASPRRAIAAMSPHAGFVYSGAVAAAVYANIEPAETYVLMGPNHTGMGMPVSIMTQGAWDIPTGELEIDSALAEDIIARSSIVLEDATAHKREHCLEVQLPFIAATAPQAMIVPIAIMGAPLEDLVELGQDIAQAVMHSPRRVCIIASTDMSHFISDEEARRLDKLALECVTAMDPGGLYNIVRQEDISMCGMMPTVATLSAALELGATKAELLKYSTSAEVSGDYARVVGYAGVIIS